MEGNDVIKEKILLLAELIDSNIENFRRRRKENKKYSTVVKVVIVGLGAVVTTILGIQADEYLSVFYKNLAIALSSITTAANTIDLFFNRRALWLRYTQTVVQLVNLKDELVYKSKNQAIREEELDAIFSKMQVILSSTNEDWISLRK